MEKAEPASMNPFTKTLLDQVSDDALKRWVAAWDRVEALVIRVYRHGAVSEVDKDEYRALRSWLSHHYAHWRPVLKPHWGQGRSKVQASETDPFQALLRITSADEFVDNWPAMQDLPRARESINSYLMFHLDQGADRQKPRYD